MLPVTYQQTYQQTYPTRSAATWAAKKNGLLQGTYSIRKLEWFYVDHDWYIICPKSYDQ